MGDIQVLTQSETNNKGVSTLKSVFFQKNRELISITSDAMVADAVKLMVEHKVGSVLVIDKGCLVGTFTERDVTHRVVYQNLSISEVLIGEVMTRDLIKGDLYMSVHDAAVLMSENRIRHLPICDEGQLIGLISSGDIIAWKLKKMENTVQHMEEYFLH